jgi:PAS domain S-box-containing protein
VRDISERKRLEGELRLSEAKSTGILSIAADAIISIDGDQRITRFNEGAEKIYGYSRAEAIGAPLDMLIPARFRTAHRQHIDRFATTPGTAKKMGVRDGVVGLRKNGEEFPADAAISNLAVEGTRVLTAVVRDVTEQRRTENEQRFLAEVGPVLATTLDYEETISRIAEMATRALADFCIIDLVDEKDEIRRVKVVSRDPGRPGYAKPCNDFRSVRGGRPSSGPCSNPRSHTSCRA